MLRNMRSVRAFTMIEMMIAMVVVAILTVLAMPDEDCGAAHEGRLAADEIDGALSYVRSCSIASPDDPAIIKFDVQNNRYWIARRSSPDTPMLHPATKEPCLVQFGVGGDAQYRNVTLVGVDMGGDGVLGFDAMGSTDQSAPAVIQLRSGDAAYEMTVAPAAAQSSTVEGFRTELSGAAYQPQETANFQANPDDTTPPAGNEDPALLDALLSGS